MRHVCSILAALPLLGKLPVSASPKYFHAFGVKNRLEGGIGFITATMPLSVAGP